jgi:hypothetical protein
MNILEPPWRKEPELPGDAIARILLMRALLIPPVTPATNPETPARPSETASSP